MSASAPALDPATAALAEQDRRFYKSAKEEIDALIPISAGDERDAAFAAASAAYTSLRERFAPNPIPKGVGENALKILVLAAPNIRF